ncbi:hypothetical protein VCHENC02_3838A, partial [Vibrio harveyi]
MNKYKRENID